MQATASAYVPSLSLVIKKKGANHNEPNGVQGCTMYERYRKKSGNNSEEFNMGKWIADLSEWLQENGGSRSREEILQRIQKEGIKLSQFHSRVNPYEWLCWEGKETSLKILSEKEMKQAAFNGSFQKRSSQLFQRKPRAIGDWVPVHTLRAGDWVWVYYPYNLHTDYMEVAEDGIPPMGGKFKSAIIDGHIFKKTSRAK